MSGEYRATAEQWDTIKLWADRAVPSASCILELCGRIEALEAAQPPRLSDAEWDQMRNQISWRPLTVEPTYGEYKAAAQQILNRRMVVEGTFEHGGETYRFKAKPEQDGAMSELRAASAEARPAGLVERLMAQGYGKTHARAAIREMAKWLRSEYPRREGYGTAWANLLEQEADRG